MRTAALLALAAVLAAAALLPTSASASTSISQNIGYTVTLQYGNQTLTLANVTASVGPGPALYPSETLTVTKTVTQPYTTTMTITKTITNTNGETTIITKVQTVTLPQQSRQDTAAGVGKKPLLLGAGVAVFLFLLLLAKR